jgi:hypothetical protein
VVPIRWRRAAPSKLPRGSTTSGQPGRAILAAHVPAEKTADPCCPQVRDAIPVVLYYACKPKGGEDVQAPVATDRTLMAKQRHQYKPHRGVLRVGMGPN